MTAQTSTVSTPPVEVMVGDYSGFEFDHAVESDVDITACDGGKLCIYSDSAQDCNGRSYTDVGERETYRVVDLNGERAVIAVGQSDESIDPALTKEARAVFDSIEFVRPGTETATVFSVDPNIEISYTLPDGWAKIDQGWVKSPYAHVGFGSVGNVFAEGASGPCRTRHSGRTSTTSPPRGASSPASPPRHRSTSPSMGTPASESTSPCPTTKRPMP